MKLLDILKKTENEIEIISNVPNDLRGDAIREYDEASREIRNQDLRDIFK